jgi:hypothetical protein
MKAHLRSICDSFALAGYAAPMPVPTKLNPVGNYSLVIRVQAEYSPATQMVTLRCMLETPATGEHRGFTDLDALLAAIEASVLALQDELRRAEPERGTG